MINCLKYFILSILIVLAAFLTSCETLNSNTATEEDEFINESVSASKQQKKSIQFKKKSVSGKKQLTEQERKAMKEADMWLPEDTK